MGLLFPSPSDSLNKIASFILNEHSALKGVPIFE
jgi:hypothetical protein